VSERTPRPADDDPQDVDNSADPVNYAESGGDADSGGAGGGVDGTAVPPAKSGIELAREALAQAKADARKRGSVPGQGKRKGGRPVAIRDPGRGGDPKMFNTAIRELLASRGWEQRAAVGGVFGNWPGIVGPELAEHTRPDRFEDGELTVIADSTTWATQLRLLASTLVRRLNEELGHGTVRKVKVVGPSSGPRRPGAWRVR
jgi:predicted nucleic acid-binding Zn ribbon protein